LKSDRLKLPEYKIFEEKLFEIQIRTILQHAWAEIEHDRNYKFSGKLPDGITRRFKLLAGSLEMSDREFNNIAKEIDSISKQVEEGTKTGKLDIEINSTSLKQYLETKFEKLWKGGFIQDFNFGSNLLTELERFGIKTLEELDSIIPNKYVDELLKDDIQVVPAGSVIRSLLIVNDSNKYFEKSWDGKWRSWSAHRRYEELYKFYGVDWDEIEKKYGVKFSDS